MIRFRHKGDFKKTMSFFEHILRADYMRVLKRYGEEGVKALAAATPVDTGKTASQWRYEILQGRGRVSICFHNDHVNDGVNIAIILQYGHGTGTGGYVQGIDYINPAIAPVFNHMADAAWREVVKG